MVSNQYAIPGLSGTFSASTTAEFAIPGSGTLNDITSSINAHDLAITITQGQTITLLHSRGIYLEASLAEMLTIAKASGIEIITSLMQTIQLYNSRYEVIQIAQGQVLTLFRHTYGKYLETFMAETVRTVKSLGKNITLAKVTIVDLGTVSTTGGTTAHLLIPAGGIPAGSLIHLSIGTNNNGSVTVNDSVGNTYIRAGSSLNSGNRLIQVYYTYNCIALSAGQQINIVPSTILLVSAFYATGIQTNSDPRDTAAQVATSGSSAASPSATLAAAPIIPGSLVVGSVVVSSGSITITNPAGWDTPPDAIYNSSSNIGIDGGNQSASTAVTFNPTLSSGFAWAILLTVFKPNSTTGQIFSLAKSAGRNKSLSILQSSLMQLSTAFGFTQDINLTTGQHVALTPLRGRKLSTRLAQTISLRFSITNIIKITQGNILTLIKTRNRLFHLTQGLAASLQPSLSRILHAILTQRIRFTTNSSKSLTIHTAQQLTLHRKIAYFIQITQNNIMTLSRSRQKFIKIIQGYALRLDTTFSKYLRFLTSQRITLYRFKEAFHRMAFGQAIAIRLTKHIGYQIKPAILAQSWQITKQIGAHRAIRPLANLVTLRRSFSRNITLIQRQKLSLIRFYSRVLILTQGLQIRLRAGHDRNLSSSLGQTVSLAKAVKKSFRILINSRLRLSHAIQSRFTITVAQTIKLTRRLGLFAAATLANNLVVTRGKFAEQNIKIRLNNSMHIYNNLQHGIKINIGQQVILLRYFGVAIRTILANNLVVTRGKFAEQNIKIRLNNSMHIYNNLQHGIKINIGQRIAFLRHFGIAIRTTLANNLVTIYSLPIVKRIQQGMHVSITVPRNKTIIIISPLRTTLQKMAQHSKLLASTLQQQLTVSTLYTKFIFVIRLALRVTVSKAIGKQISIQQNLQQELVANRQLRINITQGLLSIFSANRTVLAKITIGSLVRIYYTAFYPPIRFISQTILPSLNIGRNTIKDIDSTPQSSRDNEDDE